MEPTAVARPAALFSVLGPLEVRVEAAATELSGKPASLLALLLLNADAWITTDQIVEALWRSGEPASANGNVKTYIWQLRRWLPPTAAGSARVEGRRGGYRIRVGPGELDALTAEAVSRHVGSSPDELAGALELWRGMPYPELPAETTRIAIAHLDQMRWELRERLAGALTGCGSFIDAIALLQPLIVEDPLRESLWVRLIGALNGAGRRAEALSVFQRARRMLLEELGVEPGPQLQEAQRQVLAGEAPGGATEPAEPAVIRLARRSFLPRDVPDFVGRPAELRALLEQPAGPRVAIIDGMAGCGKTALALHAAHRLIGAYPDGQFYCSLRGHDPTAGPVDPAEVLAGLLRAFEVQGADLPADLEERAGLWRSLLTDRRVLLVLDDAASSAQIRPLLPGGGDCLVLVTSRRHLVEPDGAQTVTLGPLPENHAVALLGSAVGDHRVRTEHAAGLATVRLCGNLPVAIRIAAARLRQRPVWSVAMLAQRLQHEDTRLAELRTEDRDLASTFGTSYRQLGPAAQRVFRLLGIAPYQEFDLAAVAILVNGSTVDTEGILEQLLDQQLLVQHRPAQYRMHPLLRAFARRLVIDEAAATPRQLPARLVSRALAIPAAARTA